MINVKASVTKWSSHNEYRHNEITENFEARKHCQVVAAELSHAQLCEMSKRSCAQAM